MGVSGLSAISATVGATAMVAIALAEGGGAQAAWLFAAAVVGFGKMHRVVSSFLVGARRWRQPSTDSRRGGDVQRCVHGRRAPRGGLSGRLFVVFAVTSAVIALSGASVYVKRLLAPRCRRDHLG